MGNERDDFTLSTKRTLAERVGYRCSICGADTAGPTDDPKRSRIIGDAAHITAARQDGPRYDSKLSRHERRSIENGIWVCANCHRKLDRDDSHYSVEALEQKKREAEHRAREKQGVTHSSTPVDAQALIAEWYHETTEDESYIARESEIATLNRWLESSDMRVMGITGIGGLGKTSLVGYWLKSSKRKQLEGYRGLFYWSFYNDSSVSSFFNELRRYLETRLRFRIEQRKKHELLSDLLIRQIPQWPPIILILDGLEILQEALEEGSSYGIFVDPQLRDFLASLAWNGGKCKCLLTSRFPLSDLDQVPTARTLSLKGLPSSVGAALLSRHSVYGPLDDRRAVSEFLEGHPLALRIFAASVPKEFGREPRRHLSKIYEKINYPTFSKKVSRLLRFYKKHISPTDSTILSAISLFRTPVEEGTVAVLVERLKATAGIASEDQVVSDELGRLATLGLLVRDTVGRKTSYASHPIIRDFFRGELISAQQDEARDLVDFVSDRPDSVGLRGGSNLEPIIICIETLLDLGDPLGAFHLLERRLNKGAIFLRQGLPREGRRTFKKFVDEVMSSDPTLRARIRLFAEPVFFLNGLTEFSMEMAEYDEAERTIRSSLEIISGGRNASMWRARARLAFRMGKLREAVEDAKRAIGLREGQATSRETLSDEQAIAQYILTEAEILRGNAALGRRQLEELRKLRSKALMFDGRALSIGAEIWIAIGGDTSIDVAKTCRQCSALSADIHLDWARGEVEIAIILANMLQKQWAQAVKRSHAFRSKAARKGTPYEMYWASYLAELGTFLESGECSVSKLEEIVSIAAASKMKILQVDAMYLLEMSSQRKNIPDYPPGSARDLADRIGYRRIITKQLSSLA